MLSDKGLPRYDRLKNLHIKLHHSVMETGTRTTKVTTTAFHVHRTGELKGPKHLVTNENMSHVMRKPVLAICKQQRCRSACASAQSDQHLCCSIL